MAQLKRSSNKMIAGVCAGLAEHFGFNIGLVRLIALLCLIFGGFGFIAYIILWVLMPTNNRSKDYAERMKEKLNNR